MKKLKIITAMAICFCIMLTHSVNCTALDLTHNFKEENYLLYHKLIRNSCQRKEDENRNCTKYLVRYDGIDSKIAEIKELAEKNDYATLKDMVGKGGTIALGTAALGAGVYLIPVSVILKVFSAALGCAIICKSYYHITNVGSNLLNFFIGKNATESDDKGLFGNELEVMFGSNTAGNATWANFKNFLFGGNPSENTREIKEAKAFRQVLNEFYTQVKERRFKGNNVLIISMDFTDPDDIKSKLKFDKTYQNLGEYPQKDEEYFKKWL